MTTQPGVRVVLLGMLSLLGVCSACGDGRELATEERRPYAPPDSVAETVSIRNACPEAVVLAISSTEPDDSTPTMTLGSTKLQSITVERGARIWLRYDGRFSEELSVVPSGAIEVAYQCNGIYLRNGGL